MQWSVQNLPRYVRRQLKRTVQRADDRNHARRALAVVQLWETAGNVSEAARRTCASRSSVARWRDLFEEFGHEGLVSRRRGREDWKATEQVLEVLESLCEELPKDHGYLRSRWSSELLAVVLGARTGVEVHATTVRRWLARLDFAYRRARPTLHIRDPQRSQRMKAVRRALRAAEAERGTEVFYSDEADIDLNPRIGPAWSRRGHQQAIATPGQNRKRYLAGALHATTGKVVWAEHERKNSLLFIHLLHKLKRSYRSARRIILIVDNYVIHKSVITRRWLAANAKFELVFQPAYCPWVNRIERLWKTLHDTVTRNHWHSTLDRLMNDVRTFMHECQPWPGAQHALASRDL